MSTPFSRSIRILDADKFRPSLIVIGLAAAVLVAWLMWFFFARITLVESGKIINLGSSGEIQTEFSGPTTQRIRVGQPGTIQLDGEAGEKLGRVPVVVVRQYPPLNDQMRVDLLVLDERYFTVSLDDNSKGNVQVEVERVPPVTLLLRSAGQFVGAPRVSTSPQTTPK